MAPVEIESWLVVGDSLMGNVTGHPYYPKGSFVRTSALKTPGPYQQGQVVNCESRAYLLGLPCGRLPL